MSDERLVLNALAEGLMTAAFEVKSPGGDPPPWDDLPPEAQAPFIAAARVILTTIRPVIEREVLERAADAVEHRAVALGRQECCGFGRGSPPECCCEPVYMISHEEVVAAIRALMPKEPNDG